VAIRPDDLFLTNEEILVVCMLQERIDKQLRQFADPSLEQLPAKDKKAGLSIAFTLVASPNAIKVIQEVYSALGWMVRVEQQRQMLTFTFRRSIPQTSAV
jgi:hypothetical protein